MTAIQQKTRYHLIDELRGILIIYMIVYHALWDLVYIYGVNLEWFRSDTSRFIEQTAAFGFIFIAGFCWNLSRNNLKRGLLVYGAGMVISGVTLLFMPESQILFGVLTLLGSSMLLMIPLDLGLCRVSAWLGILGNLLLFFFTYNTQVGDWGFGEIHLVDLPKDLYHSLFTAWLGFPEPDFFSTDYFAMIPWFFAFATGYFVYRLIFAKETSITNQIKDILSLSLCKPLGWIGRKSFLIYIIHQPIVYGMLFVFDSIFSSK